MFGVHDVTVRFGDRLALREVSLDAPPGAVTTVVGGDGAGKSTLLKVLAGRILPDRGTVHAPPAGRLGMLPATDGSWANLTVQQNLEFAAAAHGLARSESRGRINELISSAGLDAARNRLSSASSGGMRRKLGVIMALVARPDLVLLDEPSTGVDPVSRVELWRLISRAAADGAAVVTTTTYLDEAERASWFLALDAGRPLLCGEPATAKTTFSGAFWASSDRRSGLAWRRGRSWHHWGRELPKDAAARQPDLHDLVVAASLRAQLEPTDQNDQNGARASETSTGKRTAGAAVQRATTGGNRVIPNLAKRAAVPLLSIRSLSKSFGRFDAVREVSLEVNPGEIVGLLGANGAGKTTLMRCALGILAASHGSSMLFGQAPSREGRARIGYVPQIRGLYPDLTARQNAEFSASVFGQLKAERRRQTEFRPVRGRAEAARRRSDSSQDEALSADPNQSTSPARANDQAEPRAGLAAAGYRDVPVRDLPAGRQRRLAFDLALAHRPELLVLDEPTSGVGPLESSELWEIIGAQAESGIGVLVTTHNMAEAAQCDRLAIMTDGRLAAEGTESEIIGDTQVVTVETIDWQMAFELLSDAHLMVTLMGRSVRVLGAGLEHVGHVLGDLPGGIASAVITMERATLDECMALLTI